MEAVALMAQSSKDNELWDANTQTTIEAPKTGGDEVVDGDIDLEAAKRWGRLTWPLE